MLLHILVVNLFSLLVFHVKIAQFVHHLSVEGHLGYFHLEG
jgi:hypothetical protein